MVFAKKDLVRSYYNAVSILILILSKKENLKIDKIVDIKYTTRD